MDTEKVSPIFKEILKSAVELIIWLAILYILMNYVIMSCHIPSASMEPTLMTNDRLIANRLTDDYHRGDIAIFEFHEDVKEKYYVKRIIGEPGDHIDIKEDGVYVNNEKLNEDYVVNGMTFQEELSFDVPENCYFMMGDNRDNSFDSRYWQNPYIKRSDIIAKPWVRFWPLNSIGVIH